MTHRPTKPRWTSFLIGYFALVGLAFHVALGGLLLIRPDLIRKASDIAPAALADGLAKWSSLFQATDANLDPNTWEDAIQQFPPWQPLPARADAPDPQTLRIGTRTYQSLTQALSALQSGETLDIGPGTYETPLVVDRDNVTIRGHGHVVLEKGTAEGKANMVIRGNGVQVRNLECRLISVPDGNGACIRLEGKNLLVDHVYFHQAEMGILTGTTPELVHLRDSRFERMGSRRDLPHGIYIGGGRLLIEDSLFLASGNEGHEIKSRAESTTITRSIIASLNARDSRLIDVSNGGILVVEDSLLAQGPNSSNPDAIGHNLEGSRWSDHRVVLRGNLILLERNGANRLLHIGDDQTSVEVLGNVIISASDIGYDISNFVLKNREDARLPAYPELPLEPFRQILFPHNNP